MTYLRDSLSCPFTQIKLSLPCIPTAGRMFFFLNFRLERAFLLSNNHRSAATKILFLQHQILAIIHFILSSSACPFCTVLNIVPFSVSSLYPVLPVIIPWVDNNYILCHLGKIIFPYGKKKFFPLGKIFNQLSACLTSSLPLERSYFFTIVLVFILLK